jgi:PAS domain S-box-containing protein
MPRPKRLGLLAALTVLYFAAGRLGLSLALVNESATAIWPPTGIAIAACVLGGMRLWPAVLVGAFLVNLTTTQSVVPSLLIALGNTAECVVAALLVRRLGDGSDVFGKTTSILLYVATAAVAAAIAATVGLGALVAGDLAGQAASRTIWLTWWAGDLSSALLITPVFVTWARARREQWTARRGVEALLLLAVLLAAAYSVFGPTVAGVRSYPLMFVTLPVLLWAALRFGTPGAATAVLVTAGVATMGTLDGLGPFARGTPNESLLLLQAYLDVKMIVMLTLAAEVAGRRAVERDIRQLNLDLERRIEARSEDLQKLHGRLVEAQQVAHIGSWEWDVAADSIWWSDEMYRVYGLPVGSPMTYEHFISTIHPDDRAMVQEIVGKSGQTGEPFTFEHRIMKPDGTVRTVHSRGRVVTDKDGHVLRMLGVGHDITDRRRAEDERLELVREQAARREAEEASRMKDAFLATLSHELRTPLNALLGWAQVLKQPGLDDALVRRAIDAIHRNVVIQVQLVSDILDVARIRTGTVRIDARPAAVRTIVEGALDMMRPVIAEKKIEVVVDIFEDAVVMGDAQRLQQVFWNLLSNAAKFVPTGGHIAITAKADGDAVQLTIEDDGPGIPEEFLPYVFDQFRQADLSLTRNHGGLGLGLAISQTLVQLHGGTIAAANRPQGGALFTVRLPTADLVKST